MTALVVSIALTAIIGSAEAFTHGSGVLRGVIRDDTGAVLAAAAVTVRESDGRIIAGTVADDTGRYRLDNLTAGIYVVEIALPYFGTRRFAAVHIDDVQVRTLDATLSLTISAEVSVTAKRSFRNLAEIDTAAGGLIGIADAASEGLATGRQLEARPIARVGEVLESVPGLVISQHSGEGKANQYYLRGFNLDHGTDFATSVAGVPVNLPTHAHGWRNSELYLNAGTGFHSNDARGTTITVDPVSGEPVDRVTPLVRARGAEIGLRSIPHRGLHTTMSMWVLSLDSELLFIGDAGRTDAGRASRRAGIELSAFYTPISWLTVDGDFSMARARFADEDAGSRIPGALGRVLAAGISISESSRLGGSLRVRHFGPRDLTEDGSVRSRATTIFSGRLAVRAPRQSEIVFDLFNLFNTTVSDIDYFYRSRLRGEPAGIDDIHSHPALPRTLRIGLNVAF